MKINFLLPTPGHNPVGGYKVVYEYANGLANRGHAVSVSHLYVPGPYRSRARQAVRYLKNRVTEDWLPDSWFSVDPRIRMRLLMEPSAESMGLADAVVATSWGTAEILADLPASCGCKYYLIQHFEDWSGDRERVLATWRLPLKKIVIAEWLREIAHSQGQEAAYIPNGMDFKAFGLDVPAELRTSATVVMLYHDFDWKGSRDGLQALWEVKGLVPELRVILFGVPEAPAGLEEWFEYYRLPPQPLLRELYNRATVFLSPSWSEGWPLPPAEAMICGTATVLTDIGGHREYGIDGETTLFGQAKASRTLVPPLVSLLTDKDLRIRIARRARENIAQFTWARAVAQFERVLRNEPSSNQLAESNSRMPAVALGGEV